MKVFFLHYFHETVKIASVLLSLVLRHSIDLLAYEAVKNDVNICEYYGEWMAPRGEIE